MTNQPETARELASLAANAGRALQDEKRHYEIACQENTRLRAALARIHQMTDYWEQNLPEVIRTPAVVSALRAAMERAEPAAVSAAVAPPTNQTAVSREAEAELYVLLRKAGEPRHEAQALIDRHRDEVLRRAALRRMADETATETPTRTPCSVPECDADGTGEPCTRHEREDAHAEGDHELCGAECEPAAGARQDGAQS